jgi:hypothetical protein
MATDRSIIKNTQRGTFRSAATSTAIVDPIGAVGELHEETFTFITFAAAPYVEQGIVMRKACRVKHAYLTSATTLSADATNNITATVAKRDGAGGSATTIGTSTTDVAGGALTAFTPKLVTIASSAAAEAARTFAAGNVLTFKTADNGTTTEPLLSCSVTVEYI